MDSFHRLNRTYHKMIITSSPQFRHEGLRRDHLQSVAVYRILKQRLWHWQSTALFWNRNLTPFIGPIPENIELTQPVHWSPGWPGVVCWTPESFILNARTTLTTDVFRKLSKRCCECFSCTTLDIFSCLAGCGGWGRWSLLTPHFPTSWATLTLPLA